MSITVLESVALVILRNSRSSVSEVSVTPANAWSSVKGYSDKGRCESIIQTRATRFCGSIDSRLKKIGIPASRVSQVLVCLSPKHPVHTAGRELSPVNRPWKAIWSGPLRLDRYLAKT